MFKFKKGQKVKMDNPYDKKVALVLESEVRDFPLKGNWYLIEYPKCKPIYMLEGLLVSAD